ncbi:MAG: phosphoadenylyl-sulfate reductase, partial [Pseudomonadota bacterium]
KDMNTQLNSDLQTKVDNVVSFLTQAVEEYGHITLANSLGAEDMILLDIVAKNLPGIEVFVLDTGRLHEETYALLQKVQTHYTHPIQIFYPDAEVTRDYVQSNGINAFYDNVDMRKQCCYVRKVEPLQRALKGKKAWITGLRRAQAVTRQALPESEWDEGNKLQKLNPLANWEENEVWDYLKTLNVPYNELHDQNFPSIGCAPCTRAITVGEDIRAGRWWWENPESKECGLHPAKAA